MIIKTSSVTLVLSSIYLPGFHRVRMEAKHHNRSFTSSVLGGPDEKMLGSESEEQISSSQCWQTVGAVLPGTLTHFQLKMSAFLSLEQ